MSACKTLCVTPWRDIVDRSLYHPPLRVSRGSPNVSLLLSPPISKWSAAVYLLQCCELSLVHLPHYSTWIHSHVHMISFVLPPLVWVGSPIPAFSSATLIYPPSFVVPQNYPVPPTPRLLWKSFIMIVGTPAHACVSYLSIPPWRVGPLWRPCHISAQSGKFDAATSSLPQSCLLQVWIFLVECRSSWVDASTWTLWSSSSPDY